jgi:hypothetical protein
MSLPITPPAQVVQISPEALEVANLYLQCQNMQTVSLELDIPIEEVSAILSRREVRAYIDQVFQDVGFNNRFRMRGVMDTLIQKKLKELDEADIGSSKDIADLLALSHKMTMEVLDREIKLEAARASNTKVQTQVNMQVNDFGDGSKYGDLINKLLSEGK